MNRPQRQPLVRWLQVRLSTWFVLIAIIAWGMLCWPWMVERRMTPSDPAIQAAVQWLERHQQDDAEGWSAPSAASVSGTFLLRSEWEVNPELLGPTLVLALFLGWKGAAAWSPQRRISQPAKERRTC